MNHYIHTLTYSNYVSVDVSMESGVYEQTTDKNSRFHLKQCIQNKDGFLVFARHINKEFAIESILFLVEIYQFKMKLKQIFGVNNIKKDVANDIFEELSFPDEVMPSSTLIENMDTENIYYVVAQLFVKYIEENGYFAINASFGVRCQLYDILKYDRSLNANIDELTSVISGNIEHMNEMKLIIYLILCVVKRINY